MTQAVKRVLCVCYGAGHIAMVVPVMRELAKRHPDWQIDLLALTTAIYAARAQSLEPLTYRSLAQRFSLAYPAERVRRLAAPLMEKTSHPQMEPGESQAYLGVNMLDLSEQLGELEAQRRYAEQGRWAFMPVPFMQRVLADLQPNLVLTTNSPRSEQAAIEAARLAGIPSVGMVDLFSPPGDPFLNRAHYADALTTIGALGKRNLVIGGVPQERIHVTGSPAFDSLFAPQHAADAKADRERLGWRRLKVILWAGHLELLPPGMGQPDDPAEFPLHAEKVLREFVTQHENTALIIRYHPNHAAQFREFAKAAQPHPRILWSEAVDRHAHRDIRLCDIAVIQATTVGLEAAIAGKAVISLDHSPSRHVFPCSEQGVSKGVQSFAELLKALELAMASPHVSELARTDGSAALAVAELAERMMTIAS